MAGLDECIYIEIEKQLNGAVANINPNNYDTAAGFNEDKFDTLLSKADSYAHSTIYCTLEFAAQMIPQTGDWISNEMKNTRWNNGYLANYKGHQVIILAQSWEDNNVGPNGTRVIDPSLAYIIPTGADKPVKIALEGSTITREYENYDMSREIQVYKKIGVRAVFSQAICVFKNSNLHR
jgi:hypothetical protein